MKWLVLHIDTTPAGLEPVSDMLRDLGIEGLVIEDEGDFRDFLENNRQYWDYVDEEFDRSMEGKCRITSIWRRTRRASPRWPRCGSHWRK